VLEYRNLVKNRQITVLLSQMIVVIAIMLSMGMFRNPTKKGSDAPFEKTSKFSLKRTKTHKDTDNFLVTV
jgi:hypothetical protein